MTQDLLDIADYLLEQIRNDCTGNEDHTYLILRVLSVFCVKTYYFRSSLPGHPLLLLLHPDFLLLLFNAGHWKYWQNHGAANPETHVFSPEMYQEY